MSSPEVLGRLEGGVAFRRDEQFQFARIKARAVSRRCDETRRSDLENAGGRGFQEADEGWWAIQLCRCWVAAAQPCTYAPGCLPGRCWPSTDGSCPYGDGKPVHPSAGEAEPEGQRPTHEVGQGVEKTQKAHFFPGPREPPRHFEGHEPAEGVATQVVGSVRLPCPYRYQILCRHRLDRGVRTLLAAEAACLDSENSAWISHAACNREEFRDIAAEAMHEEQRCNTVARLEQNERNVTGGPLVSQSLT